jgi:hypothetical protein
MRRISLAIKKLAIVCHRWMGVAFCLLFMWWFVSGIFMMYWSYPEVTTADRLDHAPLLRPADVLLSPAEAFRKAGFEDSPDGLRLLSFDGRPAYEFRVGRGTALIYADTGEQQDFFPPELNLRTAAAWAGQSPESARVETVEQPDQWTLQGPVLRQLPLQKYTFPDGQQVYLSEDTGQVVQYTTTATRIYSHLGAIPHWLYYTPIRTNAKLWSQLVIWLSGIATIAATLGMIVGVWMLSPRSKYRHEGQPTMVPYSGQKRLHTILGLFFGILTMTWAFSGMLSMDPFPISSGGPIGGQAKGGSPALRIQRALNSGDFDLVSFGAKHPREVLAQLGSRVAAKELLFTFFAGEPVIHVMAATGVERVVPARPAADLTSDRLRALVRETAGPGQVAEMHWMTEYDRYYLDRTHQRPLPVIYARFNDAAETRLYIDPQTARVVGRYSESTEAWVTRWLYHALHSLDFPWLYNNRPAWDIVVLSLMLVCVWLCWTSIVLSWRVLKRKFAPKRRHEVEDLAV